MDVVRDMYADCYTTVQIGDGVTKKIPVRRGVRQGDPLSSLLFVLVMDELITGENSAPVTESVSSVKLMAYADDMLLTGRSPGEIKDRLERVGTFLQKESRRINPKKTEGFMLVKAGKT